MPMEYGKILTTFWTRGKGMSLRGHQATQILAVYLFSCPSSNMLGLFYCPLVTMAHETGLSIPETEAALNLLRDKELAFYDPEHELVCVPGSLSIRTEVGLAAGDMRVKHIQNDLDLYPDHRFVAYLVERYGVSHHLHSGGASKGLRSPTPPPFEGPSKALRSQKQKQDQEQDQKKEQEGRALEGTETQAPDGASLPLPEWFDSEFWPAYPRHSHRQETLEALRRLKPDNALRDRLLRAIEARKEWAESAAKRVRAGEDGFLAEWPDPHRWVKHHRWEDEPPEWYGGSNGGNPRAPKSAAGPETFRQPDGTTLVMDPDVRQRLIDAFRAESPERRAVRISEPTKEHA